jgi:hypothetical protein
MGYFLTVFVNQFTVGDYDELRRELLTANVLLLTEAATLPLLPGITGT